MLQYDKTNRPCKTFDFKLKCPSSVCYINNDTLLNGVMNRKNSFVFK